MADDEPQEPSPPPVTAPPMQFQNWSAPPAPAPSYDSGSGLIPYKNPKALTAYYMGLFSIFPLLGIILGALGFVLGRQGLVFSKEHPEAKGAAHARIGIGCGAFGFLMNLFLIVVLVWAFASQPAGSR